MFHTKLFLSAGLVLLVIASFGRHALAQSETVAPALTAREAVARQAPQWAADLRSGDPAVRAKAIESIRELSRSQPRALADNLPLWLDPLLQAKAYADVAT